MKCEDWIKLLAEAYLFSHEGVESFVASRQLASAASILP